jgi:predicted metalloprotease with PDZ domain
MKLTYTLSSSNPENHLLDVILQIDDIDQKDNLEVALAAWRPGRYELGNFAKNVQKITVVNSENYPLPFNKTDRQTWQVELKGNTSIQVKYTYYASVLNAGSTYVDQEQLYVNPVNSMMYVVGAQDVPATIHIEYLNGALIGGSLKPIEDNVLYAENYEELADSPFIVSPTLKHNVFNVDGVMVNVWFQGEVRPVWQRLEHDFTKFISSQIKAFGEFVANQYHFLIQITPYSAYHGVEHLKSTVLLLGPSYDVFDKTYTSLLGVASHEFYHSWNIKTIRPKEMMPYDYTKENYFSTGYVAEGVTTYMGDHFLYRSGVFSDEQYKEEFDTYLRKHFENFGRRNYSIAQSSYDMWIDGYESGIPNRKVSIYTEGALTAFMLDTLIIKYSNFKHTIDDVMYRLYHDFAKKGIGYTEEDYQKLAEEYSGVELSDFFENYIFGTQPYNRILAECLDFIGYQLNENDSDKVHERYGMKGSWKSSFFEVTAVAPDSNAELAGIGVGDKIHVLNSMRLSNNFEEWMNYFKNDHKTFIVERVHGIVEKTIRGRAFNGFKKYTITKVKNPSEQQQKAFNKWLRKDN